MLCTRVNKSPYMMQRKALGMNHVIGISISIILVIATISARSLFTSAQLNEAEIGLMKMQQLMKCS